ncbi:MAG: NAD(P)H-hydrate dehydratase [Deltaproteobacteria bacterium]
MKLVDAETMRLIDRAAIRTFGMNGLVLMENAGRAVAEVVKREAGDKPHRILMLAGSGNNGGDAYVAARHLKNAGFNVAVASLARQSGVKADAGINAGIWRNMGGETFPVLSTKDMERFRTGFLHAGIIVDGIFGTGLSTPVKGVVAEVIGFINRLNKKVISIDVPSGIDSTTGGVLGSAVKAGITVTMALPKLGLYLYPGRSYAGAVEVADIGCPKGLLEKDSIKWNLSTGGLIRSILRPRLSDAHKGSYGHALVIAGSRGKTGAAYLSAMGAMRMGAGLCTIAVPESLNPAMEAKTTEVMTCPVPEAGDGMFGIKSFDAIKGCMKGKSSVVMGPGLGVSDEITGLVERVVMCSGIPVVLDADGLNAVKGDLTALKKAKAELILTPHPGEMARLLNTTAAIVQRDRVSAALRLADDAGATVALKGASTVIALKDGSVFINPTGNPGLATAGTGDVLSGMAAGMAAQGYDVQDAAIASVFLHGLAADEIKNRQGDAGLIATDILNELPRLINSLCPA